ncbi:polysaccharide deacetylase family protein [Enterococcus columbae]|uniref:NodB homology domain-containing protein n=1 Tax=Enterococcus columbae DSM 7374 = ATCC 51263 TaxID=1121865 RepID=S1NFP6_9ENTE|nr:polysaccharide deacetylase family protein [Enterococcus columbae]EOT44345.1 hypothetical protein OMW_00401 [Enterococcus columbae DSM 7374 = ATCC 51263]EOW84503.1 hypothetical protein I568_00999 [Enterococcus columbae DSM 7374 = ATCC 51263]OJG21015.1 hypothetical protein RR47_GL001484 [Enterococcus columbae DSM 7374 = ATCC 51263]
MKKIYVTYPQGKFKALTLSYDDGKIFDKRLIQILNKYGIRGTFHLNAGLIQQDAERIKLSEIKEVYAKHEIATHTYTHPTIARCPLAKLPNEYLQDRLELENAVGYPVLGHSYPNGSFNEEIKQLLPALGIKYARTIKSTDSFALPQDWLEWNPTCHHNHHLLEHTKEFIELYKKQYLYLFFVWGHSFEFARDDNWNLIEKFCELVGNREDIWYCTNIEYYRYMVASKQLIFSVDSLIVENPTNIDISISVDNTLYVIKPGINYLD